MRETHRTSTGRLLLLGAKSHWRAAARIPAAMAIALLAGCWLGAKTNFVVTVPWGLTGPSLIFDSHTHTRHSDGALTPLELATLARVNGCHAVALTDHGDPGLSSLSPEFFAAVREARNKMSGMLILAGLEWNIPPYEQREHVNVLVAPNYEEAVLPAFRKQFDVKDATAEAALDWLHKQIPQADDVVLIYNHPSRKDEMEDENYSDMVKWQAVGNLFVGFEGGPGHQRDASPGQYRNKLSPQSRWDPVVAKTNGTWDRLLDQGHGLWGAIAVSDYHSDAKDYEPCSYARIHLRVPQRDQGGVLRALRAGSFWADHGGILKELSFVAVHPELPLPATPGESFVLRSRLRPTFRIKLERGPGAAKMPLTVEFVSNASSGTPAIVATRELAPNENTADWSPEQLVKGGDGKSAYVRVRVTARPSEGETLQAYSNPIRVLLP